MTMKFHSLLALTLLSILAACGSDAATNSTAPKSSATGSLAGHWNQDVSADAHGMTIEFDSESDKLIVHTAPDADGGHEHLSGTYTLDAESKAVTVRCALLGTGKGDVWKGTVDGEHLTVTSGETKLTFHKGDSPHEHK